eukprot:4300948-Prymnesium_polylepis.1
MKCAFYLWAGGAATRFVWPQVRAGPANNVVHSSYARATRRRDRRRNLVQALLEEAPTRCKQQAFDDHPNHVRRACCVIRDVAPSSTTDGDVPPERRGLRSRCNGTSSSFGGV